MLRAIVSTVLLACAPLAAHAQHEIRFWHAMSGALGDTLDSLVRRFNDSQKAYAVLAEHKGGYERTMSAALQAQRAGSGPHLVQVYEVGTAQMMAAKSAVRPLWQLAREGGRNLEAKAFLPAVAGYFSDPAGRLLALPFNTSTPVLYYNKAAFRKAQLDPERPPRTWYEMPTMMGKLADAGIECVLTTAWPSWIQVENMSTWHARDFATRENGMAGLDARLVFNTHLMVRHVAMLASWVSAGYFSYSGRGIEGERRFAKGECAMVTASSASYAELHRDAGFDFGVAPLPHYDDVPGAPHHSLIGGAGLWVLAGRARGDYRGVAKFLAFLSEPRIQAEWHQRTGFVPVTRAAYDFTRAQGFYAAHPEHEVPIRQLLLNSPTRESRGIRLGEFQQIRAILEEELEAVWEGRKPPKLALDHAAERGNVLLRRFEQAQRAGAGASAPKRAARRPKK